jgi:hypothetical protein
VDDWLDDYEAEDWYAYESGYVPFILAGYRMSAVHKSLPGLDRLADEVTEGIRGEAAGYLTWVQAHYGDADPDGLLDVAAAEGAQAEMHAAAGELPLVLFGSLIVYLQSTLEITLQACLEVAQIVTERPVMTRVRGPKLECYVQALAECGVHVSWDDETWSTLRAWRLTRNRFVHELDAAPTGEGMPDLGAGAAYEVLVLVNSAIRALAAAMETLPPKTPRDPA